MSGTFDTPTNGATLQSLNNSTIYSRDVGLESSGLYDEVPSLWSPLSSGATCAHGRCVLLLRASGSSRARDIPNNILDLLP